MASLINADNGVISGSSGVKTTADASGVLALQTNGTTAVTVDTSQNVGIGTTSPNNYAGYKTLTINGTATTGGGEIDFADGGTTRGSVFSTNTAFFISSYSSVPLQFGINGSEKYRIGTSGQLGVGGANYGTSGQVLTSGGSGAAPSWSTLTVSGSGGATASGNVTLTSASGGAQAVTPTTFGQRVTLPDATTMTKAAQVFNIRNVGQYPIKLVDAGGNLLGFITPLTSTMVGLADNSTAAGVWIADNLQPVSVTAQNFVTGLTNANAAMSKHTLDSDRMLILAGNASTNLYATVYNSTTQTWGTTTLVRSSAGYYAAYVIDASTVLVVSNNTSTTFNAVILSISGTTITVNTAATKTLAAAFAGFMPQPNGAIVAVGSSYVCMYATTGPRVLAMTVSGTTVTIGAEVTLSGAALTGSGCNIFTVSSSVFLTFTLTVSTSIFVKPWSVSGTTITGGTAVTINSSAVPNIRTATISSGVRWALMYANSTGGYSVSIISVSGTTATASTVVAQASYVDSGMSNAFMAISGSKAITVALDGSNYATVNVITDTAGTASAGTAITPFSTNVGLLLYPALISGSTVAMVTTSSTDPRAFVSIDFSGSSPVASNLAKQSIGSTTQTVQFNQNQFDNSKPYNSLIGTSFVYAIESGSNIRGSWVGTASLGTFVNPPAQATFGLNTNGFANNEIWVVSQQTSTGLFMQRIESATV